MPAIRHPNYSDTTIDLALKDLSVMVGNQNGTRLHRITLKDYLDNIAYYTGNAQLSSMYHARDASILGSGQACILPLKDGKVSFHVSLYNYQSYSDDDPAVLVILATQQGTSCLAVKSGKTAIYFNDAGKAVEMLAKRLTDDRAERGVPTQGAMTQEEKDRNVMYIFSVPLKVKEREIILTTASYGGGGWGAMAQESATMPKSLARQSRSPAKSRGYDWAVLEKGTESKGPFTGTRNLKLVRDERFPIRLTVQIYAVTDAPNPSDEVVELFANQLDRLYKLGLNKGSLVTEPNHGRPTEHQVPSPPWPEPPCNPTAPRPLDQHSLKK
jgi:hypothetical protein